MQLYQRLLFPLLLRFDPERMHEAALLAMAPAQATAPGRAVLRALAGRRPELPVRAFGLDFPNPLGLAAGFDKDACAARGLAELGFGHIEVGTLTPRPQPGNPRPRIFRLPRDRAIINRMGFPNLGVEAVRPRLRTLHARPRRWVLGVSIGKQKETPLAEAAADYELLMERLHDCCDYLAVNISSPNTPGLRELQGGAYLEQLLGRLASRRDELAARHGTRRPLLVKIAPDVDEAELETMLAAIVGANIDGVIATNTTLARGGLVETARAAEIGGLSGAPLARRSRELVATIVRLTGGRLPIIGVGGVANADGARAMLDAGAVLVQVYTGLVYEGPAMAGRILRGLAGTS